MMWLTGEDKLSNVPLQSESRARTSSRPIITHTKVLFCTENVCNAPLQYAFILNPKKHTSSSVGCRC